MLAVVLEEELNCGGVELHFKSANVSVKIVHREPGACMHAVQIDLQLRMMLTIAVVNTLMLFPLDIRHLLEVLTCGLGQRL